MNPVSRPKKFNHLDTIQYEIDMLLYCFEQLRAGKFSNAPGYYLHIEGFLVHYRNLCEFFASRKELKAKKPEEWTEVKLSSEEVESIQNDKLDDAYNGPISRYISHCNRIRADLDRDWDVEQMMVQMQPCIDHFRKLFPREPAPAAAEMGTYAMRNLSTSSLSEPVMTLDDFGHPKVG